MSKEYDEWGYEINKQPNIGKLLSKAVHDWEKERNGFDKKSWKKALEMCVNSEYVRVKERAEVWTKEPYDLKTREVVKEWLKNEEKDLLMEAFHTDIEFGTGGMRGICGPGTNRINEAIIASATQGLVNYIKGVKGEGGEQLKVAIAYDCRNYSTEFAEVTVTIFSAKLAAATKPLCLTVKLLELIAYV